MATPIQNHRVFASILESAGVQRPEAVNTPTLDAMPSEVMTHLTPSRFVIAYRGERFEHTLHALLVPPLKLIASGSGAAKLFDLDVDPGELNDLSKVRADDARRLRARLEAVLGGHPRLYSGHEGAELDELTEAALRELGYIE